MYIFSRTTRLGRGVSGPGFLRAQMEWTFDLTEKFNEVNDQTMRLWTNTYSPGNGVYIWSQWVDNFTDFEEQNHRLALDEGFLELVARGSEYSSESGDDTVDRVLHTSPGVDIDSAAFLSITRAVAVPGRLAQAADVGIEIAERTSAITGSATAFTTAVTGQVGSFEWIRLATTVEELEDSELKLTADKAVLAEIDRQMAECFLASSADRRYLRRQQRH